MVESEANGLTEEEMLSAVKFGHEGFVPVIEMIEELAKECRKPEWTVEKKDLSEVKQKLEETFTADLTKLLQQEISKIDQIKFQKLRIKLKSFLKKMKIILILMLTQSLKT
jgi:polyribonucleotide nucleotidyltransferase